MDTLRMKINLGRCPNPLTLKKSKTKNFFKTVYLCGFRWVKGETLVDVLGKDMKILTLSTR